MALVLAIRGMFRSLCLSWRRVSVADCLLQMADWCRFVVCRLASGLETNFVSGNSHQIDCASTGVCAGSGTRSAVRPDGRGGRNFSKPFAAVDELGRRASNRRPFRRVYFGELRGGFAGSPGERESFARCNHLVGADRIDWRIDRLGTGQSPVAATRDPPVAGGSVACRRVKNVILKFDDYLCAATASSVASDNTASPSSSASRGIVSGGEIFTVCPHAPTGAKKSKPL